MATKTTMLATVKTTVEYFARRWAAVGKGVGLDFDDLVQVGYMAALRAETSWRPEAGASFATYAARPVESAIRNAAKSRASGRRWAQSLDTPLGEDGGSTYLDTVAAEVGTPEENVGAAERDRMVRELVDKVVSEFEGHEGMARLLVERLMDGGKVEERFRSEVSLGDIGARYGVTRQRVDQIQKRLKTRLLGALREVA